jgi:hypothetical protein
MRLRSLHIGFPARHHICPVPEKAFRPTLFNADDFERLRLECLESRPGQNDLRLHCFALPFQFTLFPDDFLLTHQSLRIVFRLLREPGGPGQDVFRTNIDVENLNTVIVQSERRHRQDEKAVFINEEGILDRTVRRSAIFDNAQPSY